jgi:hypothetical protein
MTSLIDLERHVLGRVMLDNRGLRQIIRSRKIMAEHFTERAHRQIWLAIIDLVMKNGQIANPVTLKGLLETEGELVEVGGVQYLVQLLNAGDRREDGDRLLDEWFEARPRTAADWWAWYNEYLNTDVWKARRRKVMDRCRGLCEGCREHPVTQVHHLTYAHVGDELLYELVGLCDACHEKAHER